MTHQTLFGAILRIGNIYPGKAFGEHQDIRRKIDIVTCSSLFLFVLEQGK